MATVAAAVGVLVQFDFCYLKDGNEWTLMALHNARKPENTRSIG